MKLFIDSADTQEIISRFETGLIDGVTTNPSLIRKSGKDPEEVYQELIDAGIQDISMEVVGSVEEMFREGMRLHEKFGEEILALAHRSSKNGEPIVKPMAWFWPDAGYEVIQDQFILGDNLLVAPVLEKDARTRKVVFPVGTWIGDDGSEVVGPATVEIAAPLERLPYFRLQVSK